ncbi:polynucleotide adenylyltransferase [Mortierella sp. GBA43]|nr:polynucleotide adenylyltransferase [Mortierella sp. GBA43]
MNSQNGKPSARLGVTDPISVDPPTTEELDSSEQLVQTLKEQGLFESEEEKKSSSGSLTRWSKSSFTWSACAGTTQNQSPEKPAAKSSPSVPIGLEYMDQASTDIDTLCVVPKHVQREDFFEEMHDMLRQRPEVSELTAVPDAFTPVIKMKFSEISIDFTFARLGLSVIPDTLDLSDDNLLRNLDERCIRSVNGSRVTDEILRLVPDIPTFRLALRCVKLWAQRRAINSNMMGFFGGVSWAMLVARVCQLYPKACAAKIISRFFSILHQWSWPQPVLLKPIEDGPLQVRVWNPKLYPADKAHKMPIITPAYPSMCSTHNVSDSTKAVLLSEFKDASELVNQIMGQRIQWSDLFVKHDFFSRYRHYLQVIASSDSEERHLRWSGFVESRIRHLVTKLERVENLVLAHPYIKGFSKIVQCRTAEEKDDAAHGIFKPQPTEPAVPTDQDPAELKTVHITTYYIGLSIPNRDANSTGTRKMDLARPKDEFIEMVRSWDKYDTESMAIVVKHIRSVALPPEVLDEVPAEQKKLKRTKSAKKSAAMDTRPTKKRRGSVGQNGAPSEVPPASADTANPTSVAPPPPLTNE